MIHIYGLFAESVWQADGLPCHIGAESAKKQTPAKPDIHANQMCCKLWWGMEIKTR